MTFIQTPTQSDADRVRAGLVAATAAYLLWGFMPVYISSVGFADGREVLAQRILWSVPAAFVVIALTDGWRKGVVDLRASMTPQTLGLLALSALCIAGNWGFYIWAVDRGDVISAALAYFLSPIAQMLSGVLFFGERLRRLQAAALALATLGVVGYAFALGAPPWLSLALCASWTGYGLVRKQAAVPASTGFFIETLLLTPPAIGILFYLSQYAPLSIMQGPGQALLLALAGPVTALPLILFSFAVRRIRLTTIGVLQYITPSMQFLFALWMGEHVTPLRLASFGVIWFALIVFTWDSLAGDRAARRALQSVAPQSP